MSDKSEDDRQKEAAHRHHYGEGNALQAVTVEDLQNRSIRRVISATMIMKKIVHHGTA